MNKYQTIINGISNSISNNSTNNLSDNLDLAYITCPRTEKYKSAICFGYQHLSKQLNDPAKVIQALDRARQMFPGDKELLEDELEFLLVFIDFHKDELCDEDYRLIDAMFQLIHARIPDSSKKTFKRGWDNYLGKINKYKQNSAGEGKSKVYHIAEPMLFNLFSDLTDDEREDLRYEIVDQSMHEMMMIDYLKKKEADSDREKEKAIPSKPS